MVSNSSSAMMQTNKQSQTQTDTTENITTLVTLRCTGGNEWA